MFTDLSGWPFPYFTKPLVKPFHQASQISRVPEPELAVLWAGQKVWLSSVLLNLKAQGTQAANLKPHSACSPSPDAAQEDKTGHTGLRDMKNDWGREGCPPVRTA